MTILCQLNNLSHQYDNRWIFYKASLQIKKGELLGIIGANGTGKTTLLRILASLEKPVHGTVSWKEKQTIGVLFPKSYLYNELTVKENLLFFSDVHQIVDKKHRVDELLELFQLQDIKDYFIKNLSKGYQQRTAIARAVLPNPDFLLLDEPFDGLDEQSSFLLQEELKSLQKQGITIVIVSHDLALVKKLCTRICTVKNQQIQGA